MQHVPTWLVKVLLGVLHVLAAKGLADAQGSRDAYSDLMVDPVTPGGFVAFFSGGWAW